MWIDFGGAMHKKDSPMHNKQWGSQYDSQLKKIRRKEAKAKLAASKKV